MGRTLFTTFAATVLLFGTTSSFAGSTTATVAVAKAVAPLRVITTGITADCVLPAGTVVMTMGTMGGDGKAVTYSLGAGGSGDFAVSGNTIVVGTNGIAPANCGITENVTISATQP